MLVPACHTESVAVVGTRLSLSSWVAPGVTRLSLQSGLLGRWWRYTAVLPGLLGRWWRYIAVLPGLLSRWWRYKAFPTGQMAGSLLLACGDRCAPPSEAVVTMQVVVSPVP